MLLVVWDGTRWEGVGVVLTGNNHFEECNLCVVLVEPDAYSRCGVILV